jgi:hypothetical protein
MQTPVSIALGVSCASLTCVVIVSSPSRLEAYAIPLLVMAGVLACIAVLVGAHRSYTRDGRIAPFEPLVFPTAYVAVTCLAPAFWLWETGGHLGIAKRSTLSPQTPALMALAVIGFIMGAMLTFRPRVYPIEVLNSRYLAVSGRILLLLPMALAAEGVVSGSVLRRGAAQNVVTIGDSIQTLGVLLTSAAVVLLLVAHQHDGASLLGRTDWFLILTSLALLGLTGSRGSSLTIMLLLLIFSAPKRGGNVRAFLGGVVMTTFAYVVVSYRTAAVGENTDLGFVGTLLSDLGSVFYTTGVTAAQLGPNGYLGGSTIVAAAIRQLPGPFVIALLGQPSDSGAFEFRRIAGITTDSNGFGFSLPAEGVMNFGTIGALLVPFIVGASLAWLYARFDRAGARGRQFAYAIAVGSLPFAFRSDVLGAIKGTLYPFLVVSVVLVAAKVRRGRHSPGARVVRVGGLA